MTNPSDNTHESKSSLSPEIAFGLLANEQRRAVLQWFTNETVDVVKVATLADHVHEEIDTVDTPRQAQITLTHCHLRKLANYDIIKFNSDDGLVRYQYFPQIEAILIIANQYE
ncbi:DUF7344 domain-containing protein [Haladaptatus cibarius]|uniref:DUF7344 domain-containing protein n=1 Tax=Haladaptatus cibarius TaxID=453847 RepID=UPI001185E5E9|nr:hypothetical protein [Haladaptatus cibarius]